jgi:dTDP-4-dehydrorhamnose reductase
MNALIFGYQGQLGNALHERLEGATGVDRTSCDVTDDAAVRTVVDGAVPDIVFNATAYNRVDDAERQFDQALAVNGVAAGRIAAASHDVGATCVHFSTDYVFGDGFADPIDESRETHPVSAYGRSKLTGERLVLQNNTRAYVIRTTGVYSHRRNNFVRTMIAAALAGKELTVVNDQFVSPTWVEPLADTALEIARTEIFGVYHATSQGGCSWFEFASRIFEILDIDAELHATTQEEWDAAARRPSFSVLDDAMIRATGIRRMKRWDDMLEEFLAQHGDALIEELAP